MSGIDRVAELTGAHAALKNRMETADEKALPALVRELRAVLRELDALGVNREASTVDDLRARREKRRQAANL